MFFLKRAGRFRAHAASSLANARAASDEATRRAHLAMARHFYALAEQEISQREAKRPGLNSRPPKPATGTEPARALDSQTT